MRVIPLLWGGFWVRSRRMLIWCTAPKGSKSSLSSVSDQERGICPTNILMASGSGWSKCSSDPFILLPLLRRKKKKSKVCKLEMYAFILFTWNLVRPFRKCLCLKTKKKKNPLKQQGTENSGTALFFFIMIDVTTFKSINRHKMCIKLKRKCIWQVE